MSSNSLARVRSMVEKMSALNPFNGVGGLEEPPRPDEADIPRDAPVLEQIPHIQRQLDTLSYNHMPKTFFSLEKHRPLQSILTSAREILREALPIRCLEATFVGLYLTQGLKSVDRIPLSFKSRVGNDYYRHIVLVLRVRQPTVLYGAIGLSRKRTLMYKPVRYDTLYELVMDYKREYELLGHELLDIKLGLAVPHTPYCSLNPCWRFVALRLHRFGAAPTASTACEGEASSPPQRDVSITSGVTPEREPRASLAAPDSTALRGFLHNYARLLHTLSEQYYRRPGSGPPTPSTTEGRRAASLCFMDLDEADADARWENRRRIECITALQSSMSAEARAEATRRYAALLAQRSARAVTLASTADTAGSSPPSSLRKRSRSARERRHGSAKAPPSIFTPRLAATPPSSSTPVTSRSMFSPRSVSERGLGAARLGATTRDYSRADTAPREVRGGGTVCASVRHQTVLVQVYDVAVNADPGDSDAVGRTRQMRGCSGTMTSPPPTPRTPRNAASVLSFASSTLRSAMSGASRCDTASAKASLERAKGGSSTGVPSHSMP